MATLLDAPKSPNPAKLEQYVETQINAARRRLRVLDMFLGGLVLAVLSLVFSLGVLLLDRYFETPRGTGWAVVAGYGVLAGLFLYWSMFRKARRQINPYYAARQVEQTVPNAKNSLVTWVDFEEDQRLPGSIRTAIGQKAARDLKGVDLNRAIENRMILWLGIAAGIFLLANVVVAFLPANRTELRMVEPKDGNTTVFNNQEVVIQVKVNGRIPQPNATDAVRLRMWYNPDDPESFEERPLKAADDDKRRYSVIVPAKQVRNGFHYKVLAGNTETPVYVVTCKIIPEFQGFEVSYQYPGYLKRPPETNNDSNLLAPYGSVATMVVSTNREVKHGHIKIEGQERTLDGELIADRPDAIRFTIPIEKEAGFQIWFTTPEGDKNQDPARMRIGVIDPKPVVRTFDLSYEYPAYLRFKPMAVKDAREPEIEAPRGTRIVMVAKTTRGVKEAKLELPGQPPIVGEVVDDQPTWVRFKLPALDQSGTAKLTFTPTTNENPSTRDLIVRVLGDQAPTAELQEPKDDEITLPANGTLSLKGVANDDHGVDKLVLRMKVIGSEDREVKPRPYRNGMSFLRKEDNSWPTEVQYKDFVKLQDLRLLKDPNWRAGPGTVIEYVLEVQDNCDVPPGPNLGFSKPKRFTVVAPKPEDQPKIDQQNNKLDQDQRKHEQKQDNTNANQPRDPKQPPPKGTPENQPKDPQANPKDPPKDRDPKGPNGEPNPMMPPDMNPDLEQRTQDVQRAIDNANKDKQPGAEKRGSEVPPEAKVDPTEPPKPAPMGGEPPAENRTPMMDPNMDMKGAPSETRGGNVDKTRDEKGGVKEPPPETKPGMPPEEGANKPSYGGGSSDAATPKPEPKSPMPGMPPPKPEEKGTARTQPKVDPKAGNPPEPGATKPDKEVTPSEDKKPDGDANPMGGPPGDAAASKPKEAPAPGGARPEPKKDEVANAGGSRTKPMEDGAAGTKPSKPMTGGMNEEGNAETRGGPGTPENPGTPPPPKKRDPGELQRELAREINSTKPEVSDDVKDDVDRLMRNPETRKQTREELEKLEREAKDPLSRKKAQDMRARGEKAANDYDKEKPNQENLDKLAKKLNSQDEQERKDAEQRIKDWEKDQQAKEDLKKENDELKKKDRNAGEKIENAMNKAEQARKDPGSGQQPKIDEKDLQKMAKDLNGMDKDAKADAQKQMEKMMQDPKTRQEAQDKLKEMANKANGQDKKDLEEAMKQAGKMANDAAKNDPKEKIDPKALQEAADKLAKGDAKAQQEARDALKEMAKDPKAAKEMQDKLKEMANNAKTPEDKQALEKAAELAKGMGEKPDPKLDPKDLKDLAKQLANGDPKAKEDAQKKLQEMMNDPKKREEAKRMMEEMAKNGKNSQEDQKAIEDAMKEMAKNTPPPKMEPKDMKELADKFKNLDEKSKQDLKNQFDKDMKDPKKREEIQKKAEEFAKNATPQQKKDFQDMMRQMAGSEYLDNGKPDQADLRNKLKSSELLLEDFKQKKKEAGEKLGWTDEQIDKWIKDQEAAIAALRNRVEKGEWDRNRNVATKVGGPVKADLGTNNKNDPLGGGKYGPPAGYVDPYKKFTGGASEPKR